MSEFKREMICVLLGAAIGFILTLLIQWINDCREKQDALRLLKMDLALVSPEVASLVEVLSNATNTASIPKGKLLHLRLSSSEGYLIKMDDSIAREAYQLEHALLQAEEIRDYLSTSATNPLSAQDRQALHAFGVMLCQAKQHLDSINSQL